MCKVYKRIGAMFCTFGIILMFAAGLMFNVSAADRQFGSLTLVCENDNAGLAEMTWKIYKVGEKNGSGYTLAGDFADYPVDLSKIMENTDTMTEAASTLSNFAVLEGLPPATGGRTNNSGVLTIKSIETGLYLAVGNKLKIGNISYFPTPFLVEIGGNSGMDVEAHPKFIVKKTLPGATERFMMRKIWANADPENIPVSLEVEIYEDGELFDTVQLKAEDNWTYSWDGSADSEWRVKEVTVPAGCFVMYRNNEVQFVIMNTYDNELLGRITTAVTSAPTTETVTTVVSNEETVPVTTTRDDSSEQQTMSRVSTTIETAVKPDVNTVTTVDSVTTTAKTEDSYEESRTRESTVVTTQQTQTNVSGNVVTVTTVSEKIVTETDASGNIVTVTTVSGETNTGTGTETYATDENGSMITTTSTKKTNIVQSTKSTKTTKATTTTIEKLPQTGQLWWPVPVMLLSGLIFVAIGLRLLFDNRKED